MQTTMKKVKEGAKGQKQIITENQETLKFYRNMACGTVATYVIGMLVFSSFKTFDIVLTICAVILHAGSYQVMILLSKAKYSESGQLIDSGVDLNRNGGIAEYMKDLMILTSGCHILSLYSNYFWLLWLFAPARVGWILWENVLSPYIFQEAPSNTEIDEKKKKKLERRIRRQHSR